MEQIHRSNALEMCRLCGRCGKHKRDILESDPDIAENDANQLSEQIFRCVGLQVNEWLLSSLYEFVQFISITETDSECSFLILFRSNGMTE